MSRSRIIAGKAVILIEAQDRINKTLAGTRAKLHKFANEVGNIGDSLFRTGFFGAIASGAILSGFVKFDDAMRTLRVNLDLFGKSAEQVDRVMKPLEARIRTLAKTTPFSPTQVAGAAISLAKGGFDDKQISSALQGVLDLARATGTELGFTSQFVVRVMKTFRLSAERTSETVSQLVRATRKGTLGIEDLEAAMRYASGTGNTLGVSLERMLALFTFLSDRGLVGSIGGTSLNTAFAQLTKKAADIQKEFNVPLVVGVDVNGEQAIDVLTTIQNLFKETAKLPINEQVATYQKIFNLRGSRPVTAIGNVKSINEILKLTEFIADAGDEARKASQIIDDGVGGALRRLLSTIQNLSTTLSQETQNAIIGVANAMTKLVDAITLLSIKFPKATTLFLFSPIFLLGAGAGFIALSKTLRIAAGAVSLFTAAYRPLATLLVKGTTGQLTALSGLLPQKAPTGKAAVKAAAAAKAQAQAAQAAAKAVKAQAAAQRAVRAQARVSERLNLNLSIRSLSKDAISRQALATKLLTAAETNKRSSSLKLADSIRQVNVASARNTALLQQQQIRVQKSAAAYANYLKLNRDLAVAEKRLAFQRGQAKLFPAVAKGLQRQAQAQRDAIKAQIASLQTKVPKGYQPTSPREALGQEVAKLTVLQNRKNKIDKVAVALTKGKTVIEDRYIKQLTKGQDVLLSANEARQSAQTLGGIAAANRASSSRNVIGGALSSIRAVSNRQSAARGLTNLTRGMLGFLKTLLTGANVARRFVFSFSGVLTVLEGLFLFGDKIPGISTVLERLGQAFSNAFRAIGNIATFIAGPIAVLRASFAAFTAGNKQLGADGLVKGLKLAAGIIKNQLYLAWLRFKQSLGSVYGILKQIAVGVYATFESIITSIGTVIETTVDAVTTRISPITSLFKDSGDGFEGGIQTIAKLVREFSLILANTPLAIATAFEKASSILDMFIINFESMVRRVLPASIIGKQGEVIDPREAAKLSTREFTELDNQLNRLKQNPRAAELQSIGRFSSAFKFGLEEGIIAKKFEGLADKYIPESEGRSLQRQLESNVRLEELDKQRQANIKNIDNAFNNIDLPNLGNEIKQAVGTSVRLFKDGFLSAGQITNKLAFDSQIANQRQIVADELERRRLSGSTQGITPTTTPATLDQAKKVAVSIAAALVGSASSTRGNQLRFPNIEKEQRDLLKSIDENIKKGLENEGVFTFTK